MLLFVAQISESDGLVSNPLAGTIGARVAIYNDDPGVNPTYTPLVRSFCFFIHLSHIEINFVSLVLVVHRTA